jgi:predicted O-methyltransferase YrrM/tetratricopeptide (TPR) repeat protein
MEKITINQVEYLVKPGEFKEEPHIEYSTLKIYPEVGKLEKIIGLINDLVEDFNEPTLSVYGWTHGGFVPIGCSRVFKDVNILTNENVILNDNLPKNIKFNNIELKPTVIYFNKDGINISNYDNSYVICDTKYFLTSNSHIVFPVNDTNILLYVPRRQFNDFHSRFYYYFDDKGKFNYDNLIHLCIMVKNGGALFEKVLTDNLPIIDRWTILDTGSTDGTQDIVRKVLSNKKGELFEEPFINFRDSRNRCLELAGNKCKYLLMLDDTYVIKKDLRQFLNTVRGDQFASSYSLLIKSDDTEYYSNRVTMPYRGLKYIYTIHEVIQFENNKENVVIPVDATYIEDYRADYMEKRTRDRKLWDLEQLFYMIKEDPLNPRHYYYIAQTYNLLEDYENAIIWFKKRATTPLKGHPQEAVDSWFEYARILNFKLNRPWEECKEAYEESYKLDPKRPEPLYFLGIHYYLNDDKKTAYEYFKVAFSLGYPIHAQFSLKPTLVYIYLPRFLAEVCYQFGDWSLGYECTKRFLENNKPNVDDYNLMVDYHKIFTLFKKVPETTSIKASIPEKPMIVFVADGGWGNWTGSDILTQGVGGSETYIIEIARWIQATSLYECVVFCKCSKPEIFEDVKYMSIDDYPEFIFKNYIHTVIVSRFSEYLPVTIKGLVENVYFVLHDLGPTGNIIPIDSKLKKVLCLTNWHVDYFTENFTHFKNNCEAFYYGIDTKLFKPSTKIKNSFIYSSFPNRGLLHLLQMWPKIKKAIPDATLNIYSDVNGKWVNEVSKAQMDEIRRILVEGLDGVFVHGWVSKKELAEAWSKADIWLYPNTFQETFCLTALEAAATKTLAVAPPLAALQETIGDRGILVKGNPVDEIWQDEAIKQLLTVLSDRSKKAQLIERNYNWTVQSSWKKRADEFIEKYIDSDTTKDCDVAEMYNWTHDLPREGNHKQLFLEALSVANPKKILEVGTYAGTSLIEMLRLYPEATAVAIDTWKNYDEDDIKILKYMEENKIENIFHKNIKNVGMTNRVTALKGDSSLKLCELLSKGEKFDFIYVDGSHKCLDCYADMVLAWQLLRVGGVLAVDDVLYNVDKVQKGDLLGYPIMAKLHFMEKYAGEYKVISDSYRLFVMKI